jgi:hypothetical protein
MTRTKILLFLTTCRDLSYDALKWQKDKYIHLEDLKLRNDPIPNDKLYNDPNEKTKN